MLKTRIINQKQVQQTQVGYCWFRENTAAFWIWNTAISHFFHGFFQPEVCSPGHRQAMESLLPWTPLRIASRCWRIWSDDKISEDREENREQEKNGKNPKPTSSK
jgi:hypothetical protein